MRKALIIDKENANYWKQMFEIVDKNIWNLRKISNKRLEQLLLLKSWKNKFIKNIKLWQNLM